MKDPWPDGLHLWGLTWTKQGTVWMGPPITNPEDPMLALSVAYERIIRQDGRYVLVDPSLTLDRFGWEEGDLHEVEEEEDC